MHITIGSILVTRLHVFGPYPHTTLIQIRDWIQDAGMEAWVDVVGNVHGRLNGSDPSLPALILGSHYDTVLDAGR